jgi:hypothetical protein
MSPTVFIVFGICGRIASIKQSVRESRQWRRRAGHATSVHQIELNVLIEHFTQYSTTA